MIVGSCVLSDSHSSSAAALVTGQTGDGYQSNWRIANTLVVGGDWQPAPATLDVNSSGLVYVGDTLRITEKGIVSLNEGSVTVGLSDRTSLRDFILAHH